MADSYGPGARQAPATIGQRLLWLMAHYRSGNGALNCPIIYRLHGRLDEVALSAALAGLTRRHEALRTTLIGRGNRLTQHVHEPAPVLVNRIDLRAAAGALQEALIEEIRTEIPAGSWPVRVTLYQTGCHDYVLCIVVQHYVTDGWSNAVLRKELWDLYERFVSGGADGLSPVGWQYGEFAQWQAGRVGDAAWREHERYWRQRLAEARLAELPGAVGDGESSAGNTAIEEFLIDEQSVVALERLAGQERTTLFTAALAVFYLWLYSVTGQADLAVGSMFANRLRPEAASAVGFFANLLVLRTRIPDGGTFRQLLMATRGTVHGALDHQEVPYQMIRLGPGSRGPVRPEDLMFQMQPWPVDERRPLAGAEAWQIPPPEGLAARFAFEFLICPAATGGLRGLVAFAEKRFDRAWVRQATADFAALVIQVALAPDAPLKSHGCAGP